MHSPKTSGQSFKASTLVNYDSRVISISNLGTSNYDSRAMNYDCKVLYKIDHSSQSYKHFTLIKYNSRVVSLINLLVITTLEL